MNDYLPNATSDHTNCSRDRCFHLLAATGTSFAVSFELIKYDLLDWYIKVRVDEGDDEGEGPLQPAPVPLKFQHAAEHVRALRDFGLLTNQPHLLLPFARRRNYLKLNNAEQQIDF